MHVHNIPFDSNALLRHALSSTQLLLRLEVLKQIAGWLC